MHQEAYKIMLESNSNIKVPEVLYEFQDWDNWYIVMEYIEWKTLYNLIWQEIINDHLVSLIKKHSSKWDEKSLKALEDIDDLYKRYWESGEIEFTTDREAINAMETICVIMFDLWIINWTFHQSITEPWNPIKVFPIEEELIEKYLHKIWIFNEDRLNEIIKNLNIFIKEMHSNWVYHRDLGKNFRNIMFTENDTYIIDFWRTIVTNESDYNYENWLYTNDQSIVNNISKTKSKNKSEQVLKIDTKQIIQKWKDLWLNINEWLIEINKDVVVKIDIISVLDDFVNGNDRMYNWFIYLKYKPWSYEEKSSMQWRQKIFILLQLLNNEQKEKIKYKINEYLKERKNTKKYKYANIFNKYLNL
jgi:tRNA A-37 threonylcarbamoyl transferase component Bud32